MAWTFPVRTGEWNEFAGIWIKALPDPPTGTGEATVIVHRDPLAVRTKGACGGVQFQTCPPDTHDFATTDGEPL